MNSAAGEGVRFGDTDPDTDAGPDTDTDAGANTVADGVDVVGGVGVGVGATSSNSSSGGASLARKGVSRINRGSDEFIVDLSFLLFMVSFAGVTAPEGEGGRHSDTNLGSPNFFEILGLNSQSSQSSHCSQPLPWAHP
jgi:hypothetical protein